MLSSVLVTLTAKTPHQHLAKVWKWRGTKHLYNLGKESSYPTWITTTPCSCAGNLSLVRTIVSCTAPQIRLIREGTHQSKNRWQEGQIQIEPMLEKTRVGSVPSASRWGFWRWKGLSWWRSKRLEMFQENLKRFSLALISESLWKRVHD